MTFLILFLAFVIGIFIGLFLFAQVLNVRKNRDTGTIGKLILWIVIALIPAVCLLIVYPFADLGYVFGLLFGLGCDLYHPSESKEEQTKEKAK